MNYWAIHQCGKPRIQAGISRYEVEPHIVDFLRPWDWRGKRVLEVGCGQGEDTTLLVKHGASVVALDPNTRPPLTNFYPMDGKLAHTKWDRHFDLVYAWGVVHHELDPLPLLRSVRWTLKPGGRLKIMLYHKPSIRWAQLWLQHGPRWWQHTERVPGVPTSQAYTKAGAMALIGKAGFRAATADIRYIFPYVPRLYHQGVLARHWFWGSQRVQQLERVLGWHLLVEAVK
jgi:SAM-dependent methyltransferase